jgi:hypothetical protein
MAEFKEGLELLEQEVARARAYWDAWTDLRNLIIDALGRGELEGVTHMNVWADHAPGRPEVARPTVRLFFPHADVRLYSDTAPLEAQDKIAAAREPRTGVISQRVRVRAVSLADKSAPNNVVYEVRLRSDFSDDSGSLAYVTTKTPPPVGAWIQAQIRSVGTSLYLDDFTIEKGPEL